MDKTRPAGQYRSHSGQYTCLVVNEKGTVFKDADNDDYREAKRIIKSINSIEIEANPSHEKHPMLSRVALNVLRGCTLRALVDRDNRAVSINVTHYGKKGRKVSGASNLLPWGPYATGHQEYTATPMRRQGLTRWLLKVTREWAIDKGCPRIRTLISSEASLLLHEAIGDQFWGVTKVSSKGPMSGNHSYLTVVMDSPLHKSSGAGIHHTVPPLGAYGSTSYLKIEGDKSWRPVTAKQILEALQRIGTKLDYDTLGWEPVLTEMEGPKSRKVFD